MEPLTKPILFLAVRVMIMERFHVG
jgi:hypothetical protein